MILGIPLPVLSNKKHETPDNNHAHPQKALNQECSNTVLILEHLFRTQCQCQVPRIRDALVTHSRTLDNILVILRWYFVGDGRIDRVDYEHNGQQESQVFYCDEVQVSRETNMRHIL